MRASSAELEATGKIEWVRSRYLLAQRHSPVSKLRRAKILAPVPISVAHVIPAPPHFCPTPHSPESADRHLGCSAFLAPELIAALSPD